MTASNSNTPALRTQNAPQQVHVGAALSPAGASLVAGAENYLASQEPAPTAVSADALELLLRDRPSVRSLAEQLQYVPAASTAWLLEQTIAVLRRDGWIRGLNYREGEGYCLTGALEQAVRELGVAWEVRRAATICAELALVTLTEVFVPSLEGWNDNLGRQSSEVLSLLASAMTIAYRYGKAA